MDANRLKADFRIALKLSLTFEATGAQHVPRSGILMLRVHVGQKVKFRANQQAIVHNEFSLLGSELRPH